MQVLLKRENELREESLGVLYDFFRTVRLIISDSKGFVLFMDLLYFLVCTFLNFCYILAVDFGKIRFYVIIKRESRCIYV